MNTKLIIWVISMVIVSSTFAQNSSRDQAIYKIPKTLLNGEDLDKIKQQDPSRTVYQKKAYDGKDLAVFMVAIGTGFTNEFEDFPLEEFIFWMNGKAIVEPKDSDPFSVYTGDYFIQAKGFRGKWSFVDIGGVHLELSLIAKDRPDAKVKSPITQAFIIDRDVISGVKKPSDGVIYRGPELTVNIHAEAQQLAKNTQERMLHVLNGILDVTDKDGVEHQFSPGDFFIIPEDFKGTWSSSSLQTLRILEVYKTKN